jgi:hypothetical protein
MDRGLSTWHGATIDEAVRQWASPPHSVHNGPNSDIYGWTDGTVAVPGGCRVTLETAKGSNVIRASSHAGEQCCFVTLSGWCGNIPRRK